MGTREGEREIRYQIGANGEGGSESMMCKGTKANWKLVDDWEVVWTMRKVGGLKKYS